MIEVPNQFSDPSLRDEHPEIIRKNPPRITTMLLETGQQRGLGAVLHFSSRVPAIFV
jgi:hypothetical protein